MNVLYMSVPLAYVIREWEKTPNEPVFFDTEAGGLGIDTVMAQFKMESWEQALIVEYPDIPALREFLAKIHMVAFPIAFDAWALDVQPKKIDCMYIASKSAYPLLNDHGLATVAPQFFYGVVKKTLQKSFIKSKQVFTEEQLQYGARDVYALEWIWQQPKIQHVILNNLSYMVDIKNQWYALNFQHNGMPVIDSEWKEAYASTEKKRIDCQARVDELVGFELNVKSWQQKQKAFPELPIDKTTGKIPTGEPAFKKLYLDTGKEVYQQVMDTTKRRTELQDLAKYETSYIPNEKPVRIRTCFNVAGAITGRYTSKGGDRVGYTNIQNIGRHFKHVFGYEEGVERKIISADYSTAELIAGCEIMKIDSMRDLIMEGIDLHKAMASNITKKPIAEIVKEERQGAKAVNFGYLFGLGIEKFQIYAYDTYGVKLTIDECKEYKAIYYEAHPEIAVYHRQMAKNIKKPNFLVHTALGRVVHPDRYADALNIPVQGTIGETTKMAENFLFEDYPSLMKEGMLINMVHDSIILDFPDKYVEDAADALEKSMKLGWTEISKSRLFHYHDLPMGVEVDTAMCFK
jgi:DNA polymerase I-like protein with 3'-5' exonuclease and polymerase domains